MGRSRAVWLVSQPRLYVCRVHSLLSPLFLLLISFHSPLRSTHTLTLVPLHGVSRPSSFHSYSPSRITSSPITLAPPIASPPPVPLRSTRTLFLIPLHSTTRSQSPLFASLALSLSHHFISDHSRPSTHPPLATSVSIPSVARTETAASD